MFGRTSSRFERLFSGVKAVLVWFCTIVTSGTEATTSAKEERGTSGNWSSSRRGNWVSSGTGSGSSVEPKWLSSRSDKTSGGMVESARAVVVSAWVVVLMALEVVVAGRRWCERETI